MLTVITAADKFDLTTLAAVKSELGITDRDEDAQLSRYIKQASAVIADHTKRVFAEETVEERFRLPRPLHSELVLARYPVTAVASVVENDVTLTVGSDYEADEATGVLTRLYNDRARWWPPHKIVVQYVAGYALLDDLPFGIERACIALIRQWRFAANRDPLASREVRDNVSSAAYFAADPSSLSTEVLGLLAPHRNRRMR